MIDLAPDATLMAVGVMLKGEAVKLGKSTPVFKLPADAGGWVPAGRPFRTSRRGRGAACDESAVSASDGLDGEPITPVSVLADPLARTRIPIPALTTSQRSRL